MAESSQAHLVLGSSQWRKFLKRSRHFRCYTSKSGISFRRKWTPDDRINNISDHEKFSWQDSTCRQSKNTDLKEALLLPQNSSQQEQAALKTLNVVWARRSKRP